MNPAPPVIDDTKIWDAMLSLYNSPAIALALELEVFETLREPANIDTFVSEPALTSEAALPCWQC